MYDYSGSQNSGPMTTPTAVPPMQEELTALDSAIERLGKHCEILEQRIQPVLMPALPALPALNPTPQAEPRAVIPPLVQELRARREQIERICAHVINLHERVGV